MTTLKTAISIQQPLLDKVDSLARELSLSRSKIFALAVEAYLEQFENRLLLERINTVFAEADPHEQGYLSHMKRRQRILAEEKW